MNRIHLMMPMAGGGTRFLDEGFDLPKPLIELQNKPLFYWAVQSIVKFVEVKDIVFVVLKEHVEKFKIDEKILSLYPEAKIVVIPKVLNGAVLTCLRGIDEVNDNLPILFNDCDHAFLSSDFYSFLKSDDISKIDGALLTFHSNKPLYSYVRFGNNMQVVGTAEKDVVSNEAICGAYYFRDKVIFENAVKKYLEKNRYLEFFMSGVYDEAINLGNRISTFQLDEHISFGTPEEYRESLWNNNLSKLR